LHESIPAQDPHNALHNASVAIPANNPASRPCPADDLPSKTESSPVLLSHTNLSYTKTLWHTPLSPSSYTSNPSPPSAAQSPHILRSSLPSAPYTPHAYLPLKPGCSAAREEESAYLYAQHLHWDL